jgi:hypothetical protein
VPGALLHKIPGALLGRLHKTPADENVEKRMDMHTYGTAHTLFVPKNTHYRNQIQIFPHAPNL